MFTKMIMRDEDHGRQHSIEGLAYASLQPRVKESIVNNKALLEKLVKNLSEAPPRSPSTYGALSIFVNLTRYQPALTEEQKKMTQLKAYANAAGHLSGPDPLNDDDHVAVRCKAVFDAGITPVLVTHSKNGTAGSLALIISILHSLTVTKSLRGPLAQQGAVKLLLEAWASLPDTEGASRHMAAQAVARILISMNPALVFGGNRSIPVSAAIKPLVSILPSDPAAETRDLLPTFEGLMALTNLASLDKDDSRQTIIRTAWSHMEDQLHSSNMLVCKAAVELLCNLVQAPEAVAMYAEDTSKSRNRMHILLALADVEDAGTRRAAGGALASLTSSEAVVRDILTRDYGIQVILTMCVDDDEDLRHRGVVTLSNMLGAEGETGTNSCRKFKDAGGVETLKECLKKSRRPEVLQVTVEALKVLLEQK
jgi:hypothetical protein